MASGLRRVTTPGLPPWPRLEHDLVKQRAQVTARHPTWRSRERALDLIAAATFLAQAAIFYLAFTTYPWQERTLFEAGIRFIAALFTIAILLPIARRVINLTLLGFLERAPLGAKTRFWFTSEAIAFQSRLYDQPVVLPRQENGRPVNLRFILQPDRAAAAHESSLSWKSKRPKDHLREARVLCVLVTAAGQSVPASGGGGAQRVIPVTEVYHAHGANLTMACTAAAALTAAERQRDTEPQPEQPVDIDGV